MSTHIRMCIRICLHIPHTGTVCLHMCICVHTQRKRERGRVRGAERDTPIKINAQLISILFLMNFAGSAQIVATPPHHPPLNTHSWYTQTHTATQRRGDFIIRSENRAISIICLSSICQLDAIETERFDLKLSKAQARHTSFQIYENYKISCFCQV